MIEASDQKIKEVQLSILEYVREYCIEHKTKYFLTGGTCIGAIRHKGYIPWDDDIDISMLREDYENFIKYFNAATTKYHVYSCENTSSFPFPFAKIADLESLYVEENDELKMEIGINIDLFPIDRVSESKFSAAAYLNAIRFLRNIIYVKSISVAFDRGIKKNVFLRITKIFARWVSSNLISKSINFIAKHAGNAESIRGGIMVWGYGNSEMVNMDVFRDIVMVDFEALKLAVPLGYHDWLTSIYGNYMQMPPSEKQFTHHKYKAYVK